MSNRCFGCLFFTLPRTRYLNVPFFSLSCRGWQKLERGKKKKELLQSRVKNTHRYHRDIISIYYILI